MVDHKAVLLAQLRKPFPVGSDGRLSAAADPPPRVRDASTVVLLRDAVDRPRGGASGGGIEAYLLRRTATMAFAGGMFVFPGGRVDPADSRPDVPWVGPPFAEVMHALDAEPGLARALVCAAVRETFEECGVLLASPTGTDGALAEPDDQGWLADRLAMERRELGLAEMLVRRELALRVDLLAPWARWITPEVEPRRYDTRFFVAALPPGQQPGAVSGEADRMVWMSPAEALERHAAGTMRMLPPTAYTLAELAAFDDVAGVLAAARRRDLSPIMPKFLVTGTEAHFLLPHDAEYAAAAAPPEPTDGSGSPVPDEA
jgi:8-oxo-dGTP pyrophosphatase MutT (NUDIX family)